MYDFQQLEIGSRLIQSRTGVFRFAIACFVVLISASLPIAAQDFCGTDRAMAKLSPMQKEQLRRYSVKGSVPANELLLYLHFTGATITPGFANATGFVSPIVNGTSNVPPPTMTAAQIAETIELVKDDFSPFNIQITTDYNTFLNYPTAFKQIGIITTLPGVLGFNPDVAGVSPFTGIGTRLFSNPSFTFASTVGNVPEDVANVISHEVGHGLGLTHQGRFAIGCAFDIEYQPNIGTGPLAFGPLMGAAFAPSISNWWSQDCTHPVDGGPLHDFLLISNQVVLKPDDIPNVAPGGSVSTPFNGLIEKAGDSDLVRVTSGFADYLSVRSSNIDLVASVFATNGTLIGRYIDRDRSGLTFPIPSGTSDIRIRPASNANMDAIFMTGRYRLTGLGSGGAINYTAIGDSLAFGTGAGVPATGGYVPRLRGKIATATGQSVTLDNRGNFGIFSDQLLTSVQTDADMRASLQNADLITLNIGGNDLGLARLNYRNNACGGADGQDCLRATATSLKANWDATIAELRSLNPDADIRTIDIYYAAVNFDSTQDTFPGDGGLNDFQVLSTYLAEFNAHVAATSASNDIKRGHVREAFNGAGGNGDPTAGGLLAADFTHPNDTGYELIAVRLFETDSVTFGLDPEAVTVSFGATQQFTQTGGTLPVAFSLVQNQSGGNINASGLYTAGPNVGIDIVRVTDEDDATADASVRVSSDVSCPDANTSLWDGGGDTDNWSDAANWCNNLVPATHQSILFNATSVKNLNINANVTVASANITNQYTGTITQGASNLNFTLSFTQAGGTFVAGSGSIAVGTTHSHAGGAFTGGSGALDVNGGFDISGGTFTAPTGTAFFGAPYFQVTGGTFNPNGGTVVFDDGLTNFTIPTTFTLNNVTLNKVGSLRFITNSSTLVVQGTLTLTNGSIDNTAAIGTVEAQGDVVMASTYDGGDATLLISGAATRTITLPAGAAMPRLTVNAPNVTIDTSGSGTITFGQPISIQSVTSFTNGAVNFVFQTGFTIGATTNFVPGSGNLTFNSFLSQNAGTFNAGSGTLDVNGGFDISGGTFTAPTATAFFGAPYFQVTGGTFDPNGGTIVFDDGLTNFEIPTTFTLNNVTLNKSGSLRFITNSSTLIVQGTLTLTNGSIDNTAAIGTVEAQGNVVMASTYDGGDATLLISGAATRTVTLPAGATMPRLTVNAPNVTIDTSGSGTITFGQPISIQSVTSFTNGAVNFVFQTGFTIGATTNFVPGSGNLTFNSFLSQNAGTFNAGSGTLDVNGGFDISGGTFTAPTGTAFFGAPYFQVTGGTFNPNGGTVVFDDGLTNFTIPTTFTLNNVTLNKVGSLRFITNSSTLVVQGTLTLTNGSIDNTAAIGTVEAQGDVVMASTYDGGDAHFRFGGSANQTYTNAGGVNMTSTWTVNKSSGVVTLASNLSLLASQTLTITSGEFNQGASFNLSTGGMSVGAAGVWKNNGTGDITLGGNVSNAGEIDIDGTTVSCDEADAILIRSTSAGAQRTWSGAGSFFVQDADVQDQAGAVTAFASTNTGNSNWTFNSACAPFVWDGGGATNNWSDAANWRRNLLPLASSIVIFDSTSTKDSVVNTSFSVDGLQVNGGYTGTLSWAGGNILTVGGSGFSQSSGLVLAGLLFVNGNTTLSGGEFTSQPAAIKDFNGDLAITNSSFTGPSSATIFVGGNVTVGPAPTLFFPGSRFDLDGNTSSSLSVPTNTEFNVLVVNKTGGTSVNVAAGGGPVIVNGNLSLIDGHLDGEPIEVRARFDVATGFDGGNGIVQIQNLPSGQLSSIQSDSVLPQFVIVNSANCNMSVANLAGTVTFQNLSLLNGTIQASSSLDSSVIVNGNYSQSGGTFTYGSFTGQSVTVNGNFGLSGGTFRPLAASLVDMNGDVNLTGGTFTANSGDLRIAANFSRTSSNTFNHNGGRVIFDGSTDRNLSLPGAPFTTVFNDVRFDSPNSTTIDSSVSTFSGLIVLDEVEFIDGFVVSAPARSTIEARGDVAIGSGLDNGISTTIKFGGNEVQSFTDNGGFQGFDFTLDKSGGTVNLLTNMDLAAALNDQTLDLANGTITTGANKVVIGVDDTLTNGNGFVNGSLEQQFLGQATVVFNVGTAEGPSPVTVDVTSAGVNLQGGSSSLTVGATQGFRPGMLPTDSVERYWTITENGDITADLTFSYPQGDAIGDESTYKLYKWNGMDKVEVTGNLDTVANTFFTAGVSEFSDWTIGMLAPTAAPASISGRVMDRSGRGIRGVGITVQGSGGEARAVITNTFGYYKIEGLAVGQAYVLSASSRRYSFANSVRFIDITSDLSDENFVATP